MQNEFPNYKNNSIEFVIDNNYQESRITQYFESLLFKAYGEKKNLNLKYVTIQTRVNSKYDFFTFFLTPEGQFKEDIHLRHLPPFFEEILELHRLRQFEITQDYSFADCNCYLTI